MAKKRTPPDTSGKPWRAGPVAVRRVRGPREDGAIYWRATLPDAEGGERLVWSGWGRREDPELAALILAAIPEPDPDPAHGGLPGGKVIHLLGAWKAAQAARVEGRDLKPRSYAIYAQRLRYLAAGLGDLPLSGLTPEAIRDYAAGRRAGRIVLERQRKESRLGVGGCASRTLHGELLTLGAAWAWGVEQGAVSGAIRIPEIKPKDHREKYTPDPSELGRVLDAIALPWARLMVLLLAATGARRSEIAALRWRSVDLVRRELRLTGKTGPRLVPLATPAADALHQIAGERGADPDRLVLGVAQSTAETLSRVLAEACEIAGVRRWTPHALRRLAVDLLCESGVDVAEAARITGMSPFVLLTYYRQARPERLRLAVDRAGLGRIPEGRVVTFTPAAVTGGRHSGGKGS